MINNGSVQWRADPQGILSDPTGRVVAPRVRAKIISFGNGMSVDGVALVSVSARPRLESHSAASR